MSYVSSNAPSPSRSHGLELARNYPARASCRDPWRSLHWPSGFHPGRAGSAIDSSDICRSTHIWAVILPIRMLFGFRPGESPTMRRNSLHKLLDGGEISLRSAALVGKLRVHLSPADRRLGRRGIVSGTKTSSKNTSLK